MQNTAFFGEESVLRKALQLNVLLALGAASLSAAPALLLSVAPDVRAVVIAAASVLAVYNFDRLADKSRDDGTSTPLRSEFVRRSRRRLWVVIFACVALVLALGLTNGRWGFFWALAFPVSGALYTAPIWPGHRLKDIPGLKSFYVPACWCLFIGQALNFGDLPLDGRVACFTALIFARLFVGTYLGDLRDRVVDAAAGVRTLAVILGDRHSRRLLVAWQVLTLFGWLTVLALGWVPARAAVLLVPVAGGFICYRAFFAENVNRELVGELYDLELVLLAPCLWLVSQ
jgi:4-hydroxybenzoate polyprenyltransferase